MSVHVAFRFPIRMRTGDRSEAIIAVDTDEVVWSGRESPTTVDETRGEGWRSIRPTRIYVSERGVVVSQDSGAWKEYKPAGPFHVPASNIASIVRTS